MYCCKCNAFLYEKPKRKMIQWTTGVARNVNWEGFKLEKFCDVSFVTFFGDIITMMSRK